MTAATIPTQTGPANRDWRDDALCREVDAELFFPEKGGSTKDAKRVCQACGVTADCLAEALDRQERFGIRGGLSERERRSLMRDRQVGLQGMAGGLSERERSRLRRQA